MKCYKIRFLIAIIIPAFFTLSAQNLADQLGYPSGSKLLIIHADDLAMAHGQNVASFLAMQDGAVNSASIMPPCPWLAEVSDWASEYQDHDLGIHLTLTNEWKHFRWGPVSSINEVPGLVNQYGFLYPDCETMVQNATVEEVEKELRAQIEQALKMGIRPTHLDTHMGCLVFHEKFFEVYLKLARQYQIPAMVARHTDLEGADQLIEKYISENDMLIDYIYTAGPHHFKIGMADYYEKVIQNLDEGVSALLIHCAYDNMEFQGIAVDHPDWGAEWRQKDTDYFMSEECQKVLEESNVKLVTWKELNHKWRTLKKYPKCSLAQWSFNRELRAGEMTTVNFIEEAGLMGFEGVEYVNQFFKDQVEDLDFLATLNNAAKKAGVKNLLIMIDGEGHLGASDPRERSKAVTNHKKWVDAAKFLGCSAIRVNAHGDGTDEAVLEQSILGITELAQYANSVGIDVLIENHGGPSNNGTWLATLLARLKDVNAASLPDFDNWCTEYESGEYWGKNCLNRYDRFKGLAELLPYAKALSVKAFEFDEHGNETTIDYAEMFRIVRQANYEGYLGIEFEGHDLPAREGILKTRALAERSWQQK